MKPAKNLTYNPSFYNDLHSAIRYIAEVLENPDAADKLTDNLEKAIHKRLAYPTAFERFYPCADSSPYYRIYVGRYTVFYTVREGVMEVRRLIYSGADYASRL